MDSILLYTKHKMILRQIHFIDFLDYCRNESFMLVAKFYRFHD